MLKEDDYVVSNDIKNANTLCHGNVSPGLEHHHRYGSSGEGVTDDQLGDDVEANLLIGDGLNHTNRDDIGER